MGNQAQVKLIYQGTDITDNVDIIECVHNDVSGTECDCLNIKVDHADKWFRWGPQKNDTLQVQRSGYDSGTLYLNTITPEDGAYRILATSAKCVPFPEKQKSFKKETLSSIMATCAGECSMGAKQSGISGGIMYQYLLREYLNAPAFLERLINREGGTLKTLSGAYVAIGIEYAQGMTPMHEMELDDDQMDSTYIDRRDLRWGSLKISTPYGNGMASDSAADGPTIELCDIPVDDAAQAKRWARGILLNHNRQSEMLKIEMDFNPGYTAMVRINVKSRTDAKGEWIIDRAKQDLLNGRTAARMLRCINTVS